MNRLNKKYLIFGGIGIVILVVAVFFVVKGHNIVVGGTDLKTPTANVSSIAGLPCDNAGRRPVAVMLESDTEARPLSGIGQADAVVEMPVTPNGITRFMAIYQCQDPKEIGAIRSAREDFIPLAAGFKTIYAHWGGEHGALDELNSHIMDNINALEFDGTVFYRKTNIAPPHNGFTNLDRLFKQAKSFGYGLTDVFAGYSHSSDRPERNLSNIANSINIPYPSPENVTWTYVSKDNDYVRTRGGTAEIDKNTGQQVSASVVAVLDTTSHILHSGDQYIVVNTTGQGALHLYQNGIVIQGTWKKDPNSLNSKLFLYDGSGKEIKLVPGSIWFEWNPTWSGGY
ncbi:MAG TPA: DUF3048 domain-containing protein [Candidatus Paceibacterota bacterium]|nr:DUF3048 domain-containing protein [Candidatus Paceibacterota bacterium]